MFRKITIGYILKHKNNMEVTNMENRTICHCMDVDYETIKKAVEDGAKTVEDIKEMTQASTGCGGCEEEVQEILDELLK